MLGEIWEMKALFEALIPTLSNAKTLMSKQKFHSSRKGSSLKAKFVLGLFFLLIITAIIIYVTPYVSSFIQSAYEKRNEIAQAIGFNYVN